MSMLERMSRALCIADGDEPERPFTSGNMTFFCWQSYQSRARDILAAIREPSAEVVGEGISNYVGDVDAELTWQAMIDAILEGK